MGKDFPAPWQPITNKLDLAVLGKLAEELAEAQAIVARCIIQGMMEYDPDTGIMNVVALQQELADVTATSVIAQSHFGMDRDALEERATAKTIHLSQWHMLIKENRSD